jgi:hypothetical protein
LDQLDALAAAAGPSRSIQLLIAASAAMAMDQRDQGVEVVRRLVGNPTLIDGHREINDPQSVRCR